MNLINNFFDEMEDLFLESDKSSFYELKEDLSEHIDIQLSEGKSEEEILRSLGTPEAIVNDFYEDQRLHTAMTAEKDVVPIEQVKKAYKNEKKEKRKIIYFHLRQFLTNVTLLILVLIFLFFSVSFISESFTEHYFAIAPFTLALFFLAVSLLILKTRNRLIHKMKFRFILIVLLLSIISISYLTLTDSWFHHGEYYKTELTVTTDEPININIQNDYQVDVMTIPISDSDQPRIEIQGNMNHTISKKLDNLNPSSKNIIINLGEKNLFTLFTKPTKNEITLYLPQNDRVNTFELNIEKGHIQLENLTANKIQLNVAYGDIQIGKLKSDTMAVHSTAADIFMTNYATNLLIDTTQGKTILKNGQGQAKIKSNTGLVNIQDTNSKQISIANRSGKSILNNTLIEDLKIVNTEGTFVLENQSGTSTIKNNSGKIILNNNSGTLNIDNQSGPLIISQDKELTGTIQSHSGLVKWVQLESVPLNFILKSEKGKMINEFKDTPSKNKQDQIEITTTSGDIRIVKKNNELTLNVDTTD